MLLLAPADAFPAGERRKGVVAPRAVVARQAAQQPPYRDMGLQILGPAPSPVVTINGSYRYRTMVLGRNERQLRQLLASFMREFAQRGENRRLHIYTDCNLMD